MSKCLKLKLGTGRYGIYGGEACLHGSGSTAYLRIGVTRNGEEVNCIWKDNGPGLRKFLYAALKRCEARKREASDERGRDGAEDTHTE